MDFDRLLNRAPAPTRAALRDALAQRKGETTATPKARRHTPEQS